MIKFRQKIFFGWGAVATGLTGVATVASVPLMIGQMSQSSDQAAAAEEQSAQQVKAMNAQTAAIKNLAKTNPTAAQQVGQVKSYSDRSRERVKLFAAPSPGFFSKAWETAKNFHKANPEMYKQVKFGLGMGAAMGTGTYVVGKMISNDAEKNGINLKEATAQQKAMQQNQQRAYSDPVGQVAAGQGTNKVAGSVFGKVKKVVGGQAMNAAFAGMDGFTSWGSWQAEKDALKGMARQSSIMQRPIQQRHYSVLSQKQFGAGLFWQRAGKKVMNLAGKFAGIGGARTMGTTGKKLVETAGDNNVQKAVGNFMTNHKYLSTAGGIGLGMGVAFPLGNTIGEKAIEIPTKAVDSKAYDWKEYQNSKLQQ